MNLLILPKFFLLYYFYKYKPTFCNLPSYLNQNI